MNHSKDSNMLATTVLLVRRNGKTVMASDGQVTLGNTVMKSNARKVRRLYRDQVLAGFAGAIQRPAPLRSLGHCCSRADLNEELGFVDFGDSLRGKTDSSTPTSSWDWISPVLGEKGRFSPNRTERLAEILNRKY